MTPKRSLLVISGSTRPGRLGIHLAQWLVEHARERSNFDVELADLAEIDLPMFDEPKHPKLGLYEHEHTKRWSATVKPADAFILVTPEYNHGYPAPVKNALDYLAAEWSGKAVGLATYSISPTAGVRAGEALLPVLTQLGMMPTVARVAMPKINEAVVDGSFRADEGLVAAADAMLNELGTLTERLRPAG